METILKRMTLEFFGQGQHKISPLKLLESGPACFLDVRSHEERQALALRLEVFPHISTQHIPIDELPERLPEVPRDKLIAVFCPANVRATMAYCYLRLQGVDNVRILEGGYHALTEILKPGQIFKHIQPSSVSG